jgi:hypothetical protein
MPKLDPIEFRIPATDTKGHNARHWFRCIPVMARQVEQIIQSKKFPYRTKGDLLRHALHRHMGWLLSIEPVPSVSGQVDAILEIMRDEEMNNDFSLVFDKMAERVSQHLSSGSHREATRLIITIKNCITNMPDGFWKDKYKKHIEDRYGNIIRDKCKLGEIGRSE